MSFFLSRCVRVESSTSTSAWLRPFDQVVRLYPRPLLPDISIKLCCGPVREPEPISSAAAAIVRPLVREINGCFLASLRQIAATPFDHFLRVRLRVSMTC